MLSHRKITDPAIVQDDPVRKDEIPSESPKSVPKTPTFKAVVTERQSQYSRKWQHGRRPIHMVR